MAEINCRFEPNSFQPAKMGIQVSGKPRCNIEQNYSLELAHINEVIPFCTSLYQVILNFLQTL